MELDGGKYEVKREGHRTMVYRHGEFWREVTGDNLIFWMMARIEELESMQAPLMNNIQELIERLNRLLDEDDDSVDDIWERTIYDSITSLESMQQRIEELVGMYEKSNSALFVQVKRATKAEARIEELEEENKRLDAAFRKIEQAMLPDPYDERDISLKWLRKTIHKIIEKARAGDIRDDHCLTPDEYDGKARAGE